MFSGIRKSIENLGGTVLFGAKMTDIQVVGGELAAIVYEKDGAPEEIKTNAAVLAIGHSARDTFASVSYTHLDVYKRQVYCRRVKILRRSYRRGGRRRLAERRE